jgi:hypothetical protein
MTRSGSVRAGSSIAGPTPQTKEPGLSGSAGSIREGYFATAIAGGFQLPSPGGSTDGGSVFGQYRRITR